MENITKDFAIKMQVMHNGIIIGKLLQNNTLMVTSKFNLELNNKFERLDVSPSQLEASPIHGITIASEEFVQFTLLRSMSLSIETSYDSNLKKYICVAVIRDNAPTSFPINN